MTTEEKCHLLDARAESIKTEIALLESLIGAEMAFEITRHLSEALKVARTTRANVYRLRL
jgi:hypothetical protein